MTVKLLQTLLLNLLRFKTVSTILNFHLYKLEFKKHIKDKVREEITVKLSINDGIINNDFLFDLHYLDMILAGKYYHWL